MVLSSSAKKHRQNFDSPWKEALNSFFKEFLTFCLPQLAAAIDWGKGYEFLDKELHALKQDAAMGLKLADKLVKVYLKSGIELWSLVHLEVQGQGTQDFSQRMWVYFYRLFDRYHVPIVSIAVLIDKDANWQPDIYQQALWGTELTFKYNVVKILAYQDQKAMLQTSSNPFAIGCVDILHRQPKISTC